MSHAEVQTYLLLSVIVLLTGILLMLLAIFRTMHQSVLVQTSTMRILASTATGRPWSEIEAETEK